MKPTARAQQVQPPSTWLAALQSFSTKAGMAVALIGCAVMVGWIGDIAILKSVWPGLVSMKANTAACFILSGSALWLLGRRRVGPEQNKLGLSHPEILAISVITISLLTLIQYGFNLNFGIDQLLFKEPATAIATASPGRMAPNTALSFLLTGSALLLLSIPRPKYVAVQSFSLAAFLIALLGFLGYIYGNSSLYHVVSYTAMAIHTATAFLLLSIGILLARPERGLMAVMTSNNAGGIVARQLFPAVIILPPVIGKLIIVIFNPNFYTTEWRLCLFAVLNVIIFAAFLWWNARKIGIIDRQRSEAEMKLKQANEELEKRVLERTVQLQSANELLHEKIIAHQQTEAALEQSYNLLRTVIDSTPDAIFVKDIYGRYTILNNAVSTMIGKLAEEILGRDDSELFPPEIASTIMENDRKIMASGESEILEEEVWLGGKARTFFSTKSAYRDAKGNVSGIVGIGRDISDRKLAEETVRESLERFDLAVRSTLDGIWDLWLDPNDPLSPQNEIYYSPRMKELLGYAEDEFGNVIESWASRLHPDDRDRIFQAVADHLEGRSPYQDVEYRLLHKSGDYRWFRANGQAIWDSAGIAVRIAGSICDITDYKQAQEALRLSEERYRSLTLATAQMIWMTDANGKVAAPIPTWCAYTGQTWEECQEWGWIEAIHPDDRDRTGQVWSCAVETKSLYEIEHRVRSAQGSYRHFYGRGVPVLAADGSIREWVGAHTDISDRVQVLEALKQSEAQYREQAALLEKSLRELQQTQAQLIQTEKISSLGMLVAGVAHEINNPINFIYGNITYASTYALDLLNLVQIYQQHYPNPAPEILEEAEIIELDYLIEDFPKILESMKVGADRIRDLVVSLRNFSRLDEAQMKPVNIHEGIESTLLMLQHRLKAKPERPGIEVIKEYGKLPEAECYPGQLNQVFMNLIANAIDAMEEYNTKRSSAEIRSNPNCIRIRTQVVNSEMVEIRIADNGQGMTEEVRCKLFDPFFTTKAVGKGTGLGLSISYQIVVEKHGGKLQCFSVLGEGAEFVIQIPISQQIPQLIGVSNNQIAVKV